MSSENICLIDWLSFTSRIDSVESMISMLGIEDCKLMLTHGMYGYKDRLHFEGINIHYNHGREDMPNIWLEMSGSGCRAYETYGSGDWKSLINEVSSGEDYNVTRLDIAYDDHSGVLPMGRMVRDTIAQHYISKWDYWEVEQSSKGATIYHGSPQSKIRMRIYDKAAERGIPDKHWIRCELQLRDDMAKAMCELGLEKIGANFCGVLQRYIRYLKPSKSDSNKSRWKTAKYWNDFIGNVEAIRLYSKPGVEYNLSRVKGYVYEQAGNSISTIIAIEGVDTLLAELKERKSRLNHKHLNLIDTERYKRSCKEV